MTILFVAGFLLCLGYLIAATVYAGQLLAQSQIWLFFAFLALLNAGAAWCYRSEYRQLPLWLITALHTATFALCAIFLAAGIFIASGMHPKEADNPDYVIVLGAELRQDGSISRSLRRRLDRTIEFAAQNPQTRFVLSGGRGRRNERSEAEAMAAYLCENGVQPERLLLEIQSKNTFENITYSRALIQRVRVERAASAGAGLRVSEAASVSPVRTESIPSVESRPVQIGILSSDYHLYRAVHIAKKQSRQEISGISVGTDPVLFPHYFCRECAALLKDKFLGRL